MFLKVGYTSDDLLAKSKIKSYFTVFFEEILKHQVTWPQKFVYIILWNGKLYKF